MEIRTIESFLQYFEGVRHRSIRVIDCVPLDKLEWTHRENGWTFGDQIRHLAGTERYMFAENVAGRDSRYPGHGRELADGWDAVRAYLERLHAEAVEIFRGVGDAGLERRMTTPGGGDLRAWKWLRAMVEHEVHHRAHLYMMLGTLGVVTPPLYGLTEQEVYDQSLHDEEVG